MWRWSDSLNFLGARDFGRTRPLSVSAFPRVDSSMAFVLNGATIERIACVTQSTELDGDAENGLLLRFRLQQVRQASKGCRELSSIYEERGISTTFVGWLLCNFYRCPKLRKFVEKIQTRRQELPLSGGNSNPTSGYEANERCAADHATRPTAHRVDHTSISAAPDDLRSRSGHAQMQWQSLWQSMFACIDHQHVDQSMFHCLLCLNQCVLACASTWLHQCLLRIRPLASEKRLQMMKTCAARQWNLRQHPTLALLEHFEAHWRSQALLLPGASFSTVMVKRGSVPIMANFEPFFS